MLEVVKLNGCLLGPRINPTYIAQRDDCDGNGEAALEAVKQYGNALECDYEAEG